MVPCKSTAEEVSFEWSHHRISPTDLKVRTTLHVFISDSWSNSNSGVTVVYIPCFGAVSYGNVKDSLSTTMQRARLFMFWFLRKDNIVIKIGISELMNRCIKKQIYCLDLEIFLWLHAWRVRTVHDESYFVTIIYKTFKPLNLALLLEKTYTPN